MDFLLSEDQLALQETARKFAQNELPVLAETIESTSSPVPHDWLKRYAEMGFLGINTPEALGGLGLTMLEAQIVMEEFAKISVGVAFWVLECCTGTVRRVKRLGSPELRGGKTGREHV